VNREDIERIRPIEATDLLRMTSGVRVVQGTFGRGRGLRMAGGTCIPALYIDGVQINRTNTDDSLDDFVAAQSIEGIEVYRGAQQVGRFFDQKGCGLVLVWTRRGAPDPEGGRGWLRLAAGVALLGLIFFLR
jgi:outer membrane cobalamin receptor